MTKTHSRARRLAALILLTASLAAPAFAQRFGVSAGYTRMPGPIGKRESNEGLAFRVGAELNPGSVVRFGFEAGMDRLNEDRLLGQTSCVHPAGGLATCYFDSRNRDTGWSLAAVLRAGPAAGQVRPYILAGLGAMSVRTRSRDQVTDSTGAHLTNFEFDGTTSDAALVAPLGAGVLFRPSGSPIGVGLEARVSPLFYSYSGGPWISWSPSVALTVRLGR